MRLHFGSQVSAKETTIGRQIFTKSQKTQNRRDLKKKWKIEETII